MKRVLVDREKKKAFHMCAFTFFFLPYCIFNLYWSILWVYKSLLNTFNYLSLCNCCNVLGQVAESASNSLLNRLSKMWTQWCPTLKMRCPKFCLYNIEQWFPNSGPQTSSTSITWGLLTIKILRPPPELLNQKFWQWDPEICFNKSSRRYDICKSLKTPDIKEIQSHGDITITCIYYVSCSLIP